MKLEGKVALITGAGRGIGQAMALLFAREGADIAVDDIDLPSAEKTAEEVRQLGRKAIAIKADVGEPGDVNMMVERTINELGGVHILVNNAGIAQNSVPTIESSVEHWDEVVKVNLRGTYLCCRRVGQWMVEHKTGKIVNMGSICGARGNPLRTAYAPAKAGVCNMVNSLALEWAKYNINVNCIVPGYVMTDMVKDLIKKGKVELDPIVKRTPLGRLPTVDDVAKAALFLVSDDASAITGVNLPVDCGWLAYGWWEYIWLK